jgi:hypothetical protein
MLAMDRGVLEALDHWLEDPIDRIQGRGVKVGEIHWSRLGDIEARVATEWLTSFFRAPFVFFLNAPAHLRERKDHVVSRMVAALKADPRVPGGFDPAYVAIHLDADRSDGASFLADTRQSLRLLRAYKWNSKGSRLIQLADLLLGITELIVKGQSSDPPSAGKARKQTILDHVRATAAESASRGKRNALLRLDNGDLKWLLTEQQ